MVVSDQLWLSVSPESGSGNSTITLTATANPTNSIKSATIMVSGLGVSAKTILVTQDAGIITGINEINKSEISIYPNPASTTLFVKGLTQDSTISIFNSNGKLLLSKQNTSNQIDISNLEDGIYIIKFVDKTGTSSKKFIKR
jgi:hypothetical protein